MNLRQILLFSLVMVAMPPMVAHALVDMKNANYSESWTDIVVPGVGYDLRVTRTYNSRSLFNGIFGFGWCSDFETKIEVNPEGNLRLTECGAGQETVFTPRNFNPKRVQQTIQVILAEVKKRRPEAKADYLKKLESDLIANDSLREEFGRQLNLKGKVDDGVVYLANGRESETITIKAGTYRRLLPDGTSQAFDISSGRLVQMYDKNQNYLKLVWEGSSLRTVADNMGRKLTLTFNSTTKKVEKIVAPGNVASSYVTKGEDLVQAKDSNGTTYRYTYDDLHNMVKITYDDKTFKALTYNKDRDWVMSFRNRKGCVESYTYTQSPKDPLNHFWSDVVKKCGSKVTNESKYEFVHLMRKDRTGVYLHKVRSENNKAVTEITYHEIFGKPLAILRDGKKTEYTYYDNGLVKVKREPEILFAYEYKNSCNKVSQVLIQYFEKDGPTDRKISKVKSTKPVRAVTTKFTYDKNKCNLQTAKNTEGQGVKLWYDVNGRISQIEDQGKKMVKIKYESKFGKPSVVTRPGLGTIQVTYRPDGEIDKVESKQGPTVAVQVAGIFNNLLDIIAPATNDSTL